MKSYYEDGSCTIYHGDCREVADGLEVGAIVTDPPYGIGWKPQPSGRVRTTPRRAGAAIFSRDWAPVEGDSVDFDPTWLLALNVPTILWGANNYSHHLPVGGWDVWVKGRSDGFVASDAEMAWTNTQRAIRVFEHLWAGFRRASEVNQHYHPTQKPVALMRWQIERLDDALILDPYMGSGTTLRAAKDLGRCAIGIEIEERYCEIAARRLGQEVMDFGEAA